MDGQQQHDQSQHMADREQHLWSQVRLLQLQVLAEEKVLLERLVTSYVKEGSRLRRNAEDRQWLIHDEDEERQVIAQQADVLWRRIIREKVVLSQQQDRVLSVLAKVNMSPKVSPGAMFRKARRRMGSSTRSRMRLASRIDALDRTGQNLISWSVFCLGNSTFGKSNLNQNSASGIMSGTMGGTIGSMMSDEKLSRILCQGKQQDNF